jgi:hypothetical protein
VLWFFPHHDSERWWLTAGNVAIAAGLAVEYLIIGRTIAATEEANREAAWRTLSAAQIASLRTASPGGNRCAVIITTLAGDVESRYFAQQFREPLLEAGWEVVTSIVTTASDVGFGIRVPVQQGAASIHSTAADPLRNALTAAGISFHPHDLPGWSMETWSGSMSAPFRACMFVGPKPPPA